MPHPVYHLLKHYWNLCRGWSTPNKNISDGPKLQFPPKSTHLSNANNQLEMKALCMSVKFRYRWWKKILHTRDLCTMSFALLLLRCHKVICASFCQIFYDRTFPKTCNYGKYCILYTVVKCVPKYAWWLNVRPSMYQGMTLKNKIWRHLLARACQAAAPAASW